jgi:hypothetical protein
MVLIFGETSTCNPEFQAWVRIKLWHLKVGNYEFIENEFLTLKIMNKAIISELIRTCSGSNSITQVQVLIPKRNIGHAFEF